MRTAPERLVSVAGDSDINDRTQVNPRRQHAGASGQDETVTPGETRSRVDGSASPSAPALREALVSRDARQDRAATEPPRGNPSRVRPDEAAAPGRDGAGRPALVETVASPLAVGRSSRESERGATPDEVGRAAPGPAPLGSVLDVTVTSPDPATFASRAPAPVHGHCIDRFQIVRTLGAGGMGVVYAAYDPELDREVAVKLIRGSDSAAARTRLYREAQALAKLAHPNVVAVYDVGTYEDQVWVSMELVVGRTLGAWIEQERPGWRQVLAVVKQVARGLAAAHAEGLLHRDIKPDTGLMSQAPENTRVSCLRRGYVPILYQAEGPVKSLCRYVMARSRREQTWRRSICLRAKSSEP